MTRITAAQGLAHSRTLSQTHSAFQEANPCICDALTKLLAILSNMLQIITLRQKKKKSNIQAALIQMLGCHDFPTNAAGN